MNSISLVMNESSPILSTRMEISGISRSRGRMQVMLSPVYFQTAVHGATPGHLRVCMYYAQGTNMPIVEDTCQGIFWRAAHR